MYSLIYEWIVKVQSFLIFQRDPVFHHNIGSVEEYLYNV